jgi:hypothetical protein
MRGHEYRSVANDEMTKYRTTKLERMTNDLMTNDSDLLQGCCGGQLARDTFACFALPFVHVNF